MKVSIEDVNKSLNSHEIDAVTRNKILSDLEQAINAAREEKTPKQKNQFVMIVSDPEGEIKKDYVGWVVQMPEEDSPALAVERIIKGAYEYNQSKRGQKKPVKSIGEAIEAVTRKYFKEENVSIKTKEPILLIKTNNILPKDEASND